MPAAIEKNSGDKSPHSKRWPHAPLHRLAGKGTFIVTAGTLNKKHLFRDADSLDRLESELLTKAQEYGWQLDAWAVFSNHYHFVGHALDDAGSLKPFLSHVHSDTARLVNLRDNEEGRQVWYNFWETELTYENSYLARLNYVHQNAVHHGLVAVANRYRWCSAGWFERTATPAQVKTIYGFKADKIRVVDDFDVLGVQ
jgi:putative transposase